MPDLPAGVRSAGQCRRGSNSESSRAAQNAETDRASSQAAATATAYTLLASLCVGTMFIWLRRDAPFSTRVVEAAIIANPLAATLNIIGVPGFDGFTLIPGNWYAIGTIAAICGTLLWLQVARLGRPR